MVRDPVDVGLDQLHAREVHEARRGSHVPAQGPAAERRAHDLVGLPARHPFGSSPPDITNSGDELHWRNPKRPPGLHVMVHVADEGLLVTLAHDLFGPIGPTHAYRCVTKSLRRRLQERYGNEGVRVKSGIAPRAPARPN